MKPLRALACAAALLASGVSGFAADRDAPPVEDARPAVYTSAAGASLDARPVQFVYTPYGYTWYGANSYSYVPPSTYVAPYAYYPEWTTSYYAPSAYTYTSYRPYYVSHGPIGYSYGWLPYAAAYRPYGSFYRYYGPPYGSGFHMWFGY
jgi:hypothetical protein